jgi:hypothetical protein
MRKYWNTAANGAFETLNNWTPSGAPSVGEIALISATGSPYTVTVSASAEVLGVSHGANATLDITNNATFHADEGTATGKNLGVIQVETGSKFFFGGVLQNTIQLLGTGAGASFFVSGDATLKGGGNLYLSDTINNSIAGFDTLTNVDNLIAGPGRIEVDIINQALGTIEATSGGNKLALFHNNVTNTGTLLGLGIAGLDIDGSVVTNIGGTIQANAASFVYLEDGAKVIGGRLNTTANGDIVVKNAIFDGSGTHPITNDGILEIQPPSAAEGLFTQGVIINHHGINITVGAHLFLGLPSSPGVDTTLQGGGEVALNSGTIDLSSTDRDENLCPGIAEYADGEGYRRPHRATQVRRQLHGCKLQTQQRRPWRHADQGPARGIARKRRAVRQLYRRRVPRAGCRPLPGPARRPRSACSAAGDPRARGVSPPPALIGKHARAFNGELRPFGPG